jgi:hypothetical protein
MFLLSKLKALFDSVRTLAAKFPGAQLDVGQLFADVEAAVLAKSWTLSSFQQVVTDAEKLLNDFATDWQGSQAELTQFVAAFKALFA